ncbi:MAG: AAA family ATPase [Proteobacteria bacterium]|nr:AAA family ATPase [Pseudomonadota bacterium]
MQLSEFKFCDFTTKPQSVKNLFGIDWDITIPVFQEKNLLIPDIDPHYIFNADVTKSIIAGFLYNRRVLLQGLHGTGKSTHIEQVAARLNWPCVRINFDGHIMRSDLLGKDIIRIENGHPVSFYQPGILPWSLKNPIALILDEYDAARPEVLFVLQRLLEQEGKLMLLDENLILTPHRYFRLFATLNTLGLGDSTGLYFGTHPINQGQLDRWNLIAHLSYFSFEKEMELIKAKVPSLNIPEFQDTIKSMIAFADLTRQGFKNGDLSLPMSPRCLISWGENINIFKNVEEALRLSFLNRFSEEDQKLLIEYYDRAFETSKLS